MEVHRNSTEESLPPEPRTDNVESWENLQQNWLHAQVGLKITQIYSWGITSVFNLLFLTIFSLFHYSPPQKKMHKQNSTAPTREFSAGNGNLEQCVVKTFSAQNAAKLKKKKKNSAKTKKLPENSNLGGGGLKNKEKPGRTYFAGCYIIHAHPSTSQGGKAQLQGKPCMGTGQLFQPQEIFPELFPRFSPRPQAGTPPPALSKRSSRAELKRATVILLSLDSSEGLS